MRHVRLSGARANRKPGGESRRAGRHPNRRIAGLVATLMGLTLALTPGLTWANEPTEEPTTPPSVVATTDAGAEATETPTESVTPTEPALTSSPEASTGPSPQPTLVEKTTEAIKDALGDAQDETDAIGIMPMALGPETGITTPYVYWDVRDADTGELVQGATFTFARRQSDFWGWAEPAQQGANPMGDCVSGTCGGANSQLDRDPDGGEYQVNRYRTTTSSTSANYALNSQTNYRVTPSGAPAGYEWVNTTSRTINGSSGSVNNWGSTYNFGTFEVRKLTPGQYQPTCEASYIYGVSSVGQLQQIEWNGTVTTWGTAASSVKSFNGLGIGSGGGPVYAYERTNNSRTVTMYKFDTTSGIWSNTGDTYNTNSSTNGGFTGALVAGAVNLTDDTYMFGGFRTVDNGWGTNPRYEQRFQIWKYDPAANPKFTYLGYVRTATQQNSDNFGSANGDMAFNSSGDLFIVRGTGGTTKVYTVAKDDLDNANQGLINGSETDSVSTMDDVNGVAFDADGRGFLGADSEIRSYDMPEWEYIKTVVQESTPRKYSGTDLASCSSPPTVEIEKYVVGRVNESDQFKLTLTMGTNQIGTATTAGQNTGIQDQRISTPARRNVNLTFGETGANGANLGQYATSWRCLLNGQEQPVWQSGTGTSGTIQIPTDGEKVECRFYNSPLIANINIHKDVTDHEGNNPQPAADWTVGASTTATPGSSVIQTPSGTQQTNNSGDASWSIQFGKVDDRATVTVHEMMENGYEFEDGYCEIEPLDGDIREIDLDGPEQTALDDVKPGDQVNCFYTNKESLGSVTWQKIDDQNPVNHLAGSKWKITGPGFDAQDAEFTDCVEDSAGDCTDLDKDPRAGYFELKDLAWGTYTVTEIDPPAGHTGSSVFTFEVKAGETQIDKGQFENKRIPGTVIWSKVDGKGNPLAGSVWQITPTGGTAFDVEDCIGNVAADCAEAVDKDHSAGHFKVEGLAWGDYTLSEKTPPPGYKLAVIPDEDGVFKISADKLNHEFKVAFVNEQMDGPDLPLTGGIGRDHLYLAGTLALLLSMAAYGTVKVRGRRNPHGA